MPQTRSITGALKRLLMNSPRPIYGLDSERRLVFCNPACEQWLGLALSDIIDTPCNYHSEDDSPTIATRLAGLCPPPDVFAGDGGEAVVHFEVPSGAVESLKRRRGWFLPLGCAEEPHGIIAVLHTDDLPPDEARQKVESEASGAALHERLAQLRRRMKPRFAMDQFIGQSPAIVRAREQMRIAVASRCRTLIVGAPGSGREHLARTIFYHQSSDKLGALVPLACPLLDAELLETTFSAYVNRYPEFEDEEPPSFLLLDADQLPREIQGTLLDLLQSDPPVHCLTTSERPLSELVTATGFHRGLAEWLGPLTIRLPSLSERREDIPLLAQALLERLNAAGQRQRTGFTREALEQLAAYPWSGNVDELKQFVFQAADKARGTVVDVPDLPAAVELAAKQEAHPRREEETDLDGFLEDVERELLERALRRAKGNKAQAARLLNINRTRLLRRLQHFGLQDE